MLFSCLAAQPDLNFLSNFTYSQNCSDIWGYAKNNREYALVGVKTGLSIVDVTVPTNPVEIDFIPGANSSWRDIKTNGDFAYVTNESDGGLLIVDLTPLPDTIQQYSNYKPVINGFPAMGDSHNLYIDEFGFIYVVGATENSGGAIIFDTNVDPWMPPIVGYGPATYTHDVYVRNNKMYSSEFGTGQFAIYDVSDKTNVIYLGSANSPATATHNAWISDDAQSIFVTDETGNAPVSAFDISDYNNITLVDEFRPQATLGLGVIPHNGHVLNDFVVTSFYTDGVVVIDGSRPHNMIQVGQYDSWQGGDGGFSGCWGAYPFLPSGNIIISDINSGLYVLGNNYQRACWLEGKITDASNSNPIQGAVIEMLNTIVTDQSDISGDYATGNATAGAYDIRISKAGFVPQVITVSLANGQVTTLDVALMPAVSFVFSGIVQDYVTGAPLPNAEVRFRSTIYDLTTRTDATGQFTIPTFYEDFYAVYAGKWGYLTTERLNQNITNTGVSYVLEIDKGIQDEFVLDLGWVVSGDSTDADWEIGNPGPTKFQGNPSNPGDDIQTDIGDQCYVTGKLGGGVIADDVDAGATILTSPVFDVSAMTVPSISFYLWFYNAGTGTPDDHMVVRLSNGSTTVELDSLTSSQNAWTLYDIQIGQYLTPSSTMQFEVEIADIGNEHIVEGGLDLFKAYDLTTVSNEAVVEEARFEVYPNPSREAFTVVFNEEIKSNAQLVISDISGRTIVSYFVNNKRIQVGDELNAGIYFLHVISNDGGSETKKIIKY